MLARVQVHHEIDEGAFQFCAGASETDKTAPAEFCRPLRIKKIQSCAERSVICRFDQLRFLAPSADDSICAGILANGNALMRQVRNLKKQVVLSRLGSRRSRIEIGDLIADLANTLLEFVSRIAARPFFADLFARPVT